MSSSLRIPRTNLMPHGGHLDDIWSNIPSLSCRSSSCELLDCSWPRAAYLPDMPSLPLSADHQGQPSIRTIPEPDVSEWSELLVNEQEVATVGGIVCMAASNAIELTPLWPKNHHSPLHHKGWPADHKGKSGRGTAPQPPPLPSSCPPAVPSKSKNPPPAPPLPATSSREFRKQQETKRLANGHGQEQAAPGNEIKGPAPQPPVLHPNSPVTSQPLR